MELPSFRAYINNRMVYFEKKGHITDIIAFCADNWVHLAHNQMDDEVATWESMYVTSKKDEGDIPIMICAEFKDKKDSYIWESDIVTSSKNDREYGIVQFSMYHGIEIIGVETQTPWDYLTIESVYNLKHIERLGDIYQNKELLERKIHEQG